MEPRQECRGNSSLSFASQLFGLLQWSRGRNAAETSRGRTEIAERPTLQWSRGRNAAETRVIRSMMGC